MRNRLPRGGEVGPPVQPPGDGPAPVGPRPGPTAEHRRGHRLACLRGPGRARTNTVSAQAQDHHRLRTQGRCLGRQGLWHRGAAPPARGGHPKGSPGPPGWSPRGRRRGGKRPPQAKGARGWERTGRGPSGPLARVGGVVADRGRPPEFKVDAATEDLEPGCHHVIDRGCRGRPAPSALSS